MGARVSERRGEQGEAPALGDGEEEAVQLLVEAGGSAAVAAGGWGRGVGSSL